MILILAYWSYLFLLTSLFGLGTQHFLKLRYKDPFITFFIGGFTITVISSFWSFFSGLNIFFEVGLASVALSLFIILKRQYRQFMFSLKAKISNVPLWLKILLVAIAIFTLAQSAGAPYMIDNESYYIQTIKWLDGYGFVPGLANLHFFLSQMSGWHILQAATNLDGIYGHFNDLSGFFLIVTNAFAISRLAVYFKAKNTTDLSIGLFPIGNVFLFQFVGAPSPDIGVYCCFLFIVWLYLNQEQKPVTTIFILCVFAIYIKLTALFFVIIPLVLFPKSRTSIVLKILPIGILMSILYIAKSSIITGYPLYPITGFSIDSISWKLPGALQEFYTDQTRLHGYGMTAEMFEQMSVLGRFKQWLVMPKLHGLFNLGITIILLVFPVAVFKSTQRKKYALLYGICWLQMILLWVTSPQYRYFYMFFILFVTILVSTFIKKEPFIKYGIILATVISAIPLFFPINLNAFTETSFHLELNTFNSKNILLPHPKTRYTEALYENYSLNDLQINTPTNIDFFWGTGDGPLPCVQKDQVLYFNQLYHFIPQQRTVYLKDGFYSKQLDHE